MVKDGGAYKVTVLVALHNGVTAVQHQGGALGYALVNIGQYLFIMLFVSDGTQAGAFVPGGAAVHFLRLPFQFGYKGVCNAVLYHAAGQRHAALTGTAECRVDHAGYRTL